MNIKRLDKIISSQYGISRSITKAIIHRGKVKVDGAVVRDPSLQVDIDSVRIEYKGQALSYKEHVYIIMNKPKGVLSASEDKTRETVVDLVPPELSRQGLFPVGRLDRDTTGLLIISPKKNIMKTYSVILDGEVTDDMVRLFGDGVVLADGTKCKKAILRRIDENSAEINITEGKYHQIKRMFGVVGLGFNELKRIALGNLKLPENMSEGEARELSEAEKFQIFDN